MQLNLKPIFYDEQVLFDFMGHKVKKMSGWYNQGYYC